MGVYEGRGQISKATKELLLRWEHARTEWDDPMSRAFEKDRLAPLERDVRQAAGAMDQMGALLRRIRSACE